MKLDSNFLCELVYDSTPSYSPLFENITFYEDKCSFARKKIKDIENFIDEYIVNEETGKMLLKEEYNNFVEYYISLFREEIEKHLENIPKVKEEDNNIKDFSRYNNIPKDKETKRIKIKKEVLEILLFEKKIYKTNFKNIEKQYEVKHVVWYGDFLNKIDLSEIDFNNIDKRIDLSNTNANKDYVCFDFSVLEEPLNTFQKILKKIREK